MKRKKPTAEEIRAWREAREAHIQALRARVEWIKAELETRRAARPQE